MDVMIIESSGLIRSSMLRALAAVPALRLLTEAEDGDKALALMAVQRPDLVLIDLSLFSGIPLSLLTRLRGTGFGGWIIVLTDSPYPRLCELCRELGADAVFDKTMEFDRLIESLQAVIPPRPANEVERLLTLERLAVLDTPEEKAFDDLAALAAAIAGTPIALVSLVNGTRQWFKAHHGLAARETSRSVAFCAYAINGEDLFVVEDASADPRFASNPLVRGDPHIRFYAGMPLVMSGGEALGTLCVIDREPRRLSAVQQEALRVLAHNVVTEFDLRLRIRSLEEEAGRRHSAEALAVQLATRDALTGLPNRLTLLDRLQQALLRAERDKMPAAFMFLDFDNFKWVNDTFGHQVGDGLLQAVAERLVDLVRESDTVARLGGDEFGLVLAGVDGTEAASRIADKLLARLAAPLDIGGHHIVPHCSIGIALYPEHGRSGEELMRHADLALYHAKEAGGKAGCFYAESMGRRAEERLLLEIDLRDGLCRDEFEVWYQPQVSFASGEVVAVEALLRWQHPRLGQIPPSRFIPLAEECGLIWELGAHVLERALAQVRAWDAHGHKVQRMAVNVSARQLRPGFAQLVEDLLAASGVDPRRLELEITESTYGLDGPHLLELIRRLSLRGVGFAVDDFGVGYSSLAQLKRFPVSVLKIDRAFTEELVGSAQNRAIVQAITTLSRILGLRTVAEGVEEVEQNHILRELGCDDAQGYFHGRPMPPAQLESWLGACRPA